MIIMSKSYTSLPYVRPNSAYLGLYFSLVHSFSVERFDDPQNSFRKSPTLKFRKCPLSWASAVGFSPSHFCCELMFIVNLSTVLEIFFLLWNQDRRIRSLLPWSRWSPFKVGIVVHVVCVSPKILDIAPWQSRDGYRQHHLCHDRHFAVIFATWRHSKDRYWSRNRGLPLNSFLQRHVCPVEHWNSCCHRDMITGLPNARSWCLRWH